MTSWTPTDLLSCTGGEGDDILNADQLVLAEYQDSGLHGGSGNDLLYGDMGYLKVEGDDGDDTITGAGYAGGWGGDGNDLLTSNWYANGGNGSDILLNNLTGSGGDGGDDFIAQGSEDGISGDAGSDFLEIPSGWNEGVMETTS
jgi:hypothetical protein